MRSQSLIAAFGAVLSIAACQAPPPPGFEQIVARAEALEEPAFDPTRRGEPGYAEIFRAAQHEILRQKAALLLDAIRYHPDDPRVAALADHRWELLTRNQQLLDIADEVLTDIETVLAEVDDPMVARHGAYWRALLGGHQAADTGEPVLGPILGFVDEHPTDPRGATLLLQVANHPAADRDARRTAWQRIADLHPQSYWGPYAPGQIRRIDRTGEPLELHFETFRGGEEISSDTLAGRLVVLDFWATTCAPCVTALPEMRRLYAEYGDRGVEFVGVSLDLPEERGGRDAIGRFLERYEVPWPIYYQGGGYRSEFSLSWGVGGIPEVFLLDREGRLVSTEARDRLAELIPEYL